MCGKQVFDCLIPHFSQTRSGWCLTRQVKGQGSQRDINFASPVVRQWAVSRWKWRNKKGSVIFKRNLTRQLSTAHSISMFNQVPHCRIAWFWTFDLLGCYAGFIGGWLRTFRRGLSVPSARIKRSASSYSSTWPPWLLEIGTLGLPEPSVTNHQQTPRSIPEERL